VPITPKDQIAIADHARIARIESVGAQIIRRDVETIGMMERARDLAFVTEDQILELAALSDEALKAQGWTRQELAVAADSRVAAGQVPFYLKASHERHLAAVHRAPVNTAPRASVIAIPVAPQFQGDYDKDEET
jgi:hypothetical protein